MRRLALGILSQACKEARRGDAKAQRWLVCRPNRMRELILTETQLHQDDLDRFVKEIRDGKDR